LWVRKNSSGSLAFPSNAFGCQLYWHCGILVYSSIPDVWHSEDSAGINLCSYGSFSLLLAPLTLHLLEVNGRRKWKLFEC